jgi:chaperonin GroEL
MREKKDRVDDALHATKAAIEEGILPGGGVALLNASKTLDSSKKGHSIVKKACAKPFEQILINAGWEDKDAAAKGTYELSSDDKWNGVNVDDGSIIDFKENGIIDPTKVTRLALENAASIAGTVLLTECTLTQDKGSVEERMRIVQDATKGDLATNARTHGSY